MATIWKRWLNLKDAKDIQVFTILKVCNSFFVRLMLVFFLLIVSTAVEINWLISSLVSTGSDLGPDLWISLILPLNISACWLQTAAAGRCHRWARPKRTSWCSRKLQASSSSTSGSSPASTLHRTAWTPPTSTPSRSGTLAASWVCAFTLLTASGAASQQLLRTFRKWMWNIWISVALNYQSEGRVLQLNRAKFYSNGNCGYIFKPSCMCEGLYRMWFSFKLFTVCFQQFHTS